MKYHTLRTLLSAPKDSISKYEEPGVYKLICGDCGAVYIGESGRQIRMRVNEHRRAYVKKVQDRYTSSYKSAFADHLIDSNHSMKKMSITILHIERNAQKRVALEAHEVIKHVQHNVIVLNK